MRFDYRQFVAPVLFRKQPSLAPGFASVASGSVVGCVRDHNEDAVRVNERAGLLVVADGMGGHAAGEVASRLVADVMESAVAGRGLDLADAMVEANEAVIKAASDGRGAPGMGTTCVACRPIEPGLELAWVGDSRLYRMRDGDLRLLSHDHSYVQTLVDAGMLAAEEASHHPERNVLSRCIGLERLGRADIDRAVRSLCSGDRILLCSDGLTGEIPDGDIADILGCHPSDQEAVDALIELALAAGGHDNISVIVATA